MEYGFLEEATKEQLIEILRLSNENRVISTTDLILKMVNEYGENVWDLFTNQDYATGLRRAEIFYDRIKSAGEEGLLPDPRVFRKHLRSVIGVIGIAHHFDEIMEGDPATGRFKLSYEIDNCPYESHWKKMGLSSDIRLKLCRCLGWE